MTEDRVVTMLPISTWEIDCGIAEYTKHLHDGLMSLPWPHPKIHVCTPDPRHLDPQEYFTRWYHGHPDNLIAHDVIWLNYHAALHSRWGPNEVLRLRAEGRPVVITYHDSGVPNSDQCLRLYAAIHDHRGAAPGTFIIHEPCNDLPGAIYIRQGVPAWRAPYIFNQAFADRPPSPFDDIAERVQDQIGWHFARNHRPVVGTVGFPFPWKNYDLLCEAAALAGWSVLLIAPRATGEQIAVWRRLNPWTGIVRCFIPAETVVSYLSGCDATAFLYMCANTGTSGAIRQGLAARKPLLATAGCRQFRDLELDVPKPLHGGIQWLSDLSVEGVSWALSNLPITPLDAGIHRIAERDSWTNQAIRYAEIIASVVSQ